MGAGEDALFELITMILTCPKGSLILIDEIELGLHAEAQRRLIAELKSLCYDRHLQIICTTHSGHVLDSLPRKGRIFLKKTGPATIVVTGISSEYATGLLTGTSSKELLVLVEDEIAEAIVCASMDGATRHRVSTLSVGADIAVVRHLAARYREGHASDTCAILDGDKSTQIEHLIKKFQEALSNKHKNVGVWARNHIAFLPSSTWPEAWLMSQESTRFVAELSKRWRMSEEEVGQALQTGRRADEHSEIYEVARAVSLESTQVARDLAEVAVQYGSGLEDIDAFIHTLLG